MLLHSIKLGIRYNDLYGYLAYILNNDVVIVL